MKTVNDLLVHNYILDGTLKFKNTFLVGDNASAKTFILEKTLSNNKSVKKCYYISVQNRNISIDEIKILNSINLKRDTSKKLLERRLNSLQSEQDLWVDNSLGVHVFAILFLSKKYHELISGFFESSIDSILHSSMFSSYYVTLINGVEHQKLSNGISSIIRLLIEVELATELGCDIIFIDEIEKYLDSNNSYKLIRFIQEKYHDLQFVITTHSDDIIVGGTDFNIINIINSDNDVNEKQVEIYNSNDYNSSSLVKRKFFQLHENIEYSDKFKRVNDIYNNLLVKDFISKKEIQYLRDIAEPSLPDKINNILKEIYFLMGVKS